MYWCIGNVKTRGDLSSQSNWFSETHKFTFLPKHVYSNLNSSPDSWEQVQILTPRVRLSYSSRSRVGDFFSKLSPAQILEIVSHLKIKNGHSKDCTQFIPKQSNENEMCNLKSGEVGRGPSKSFHLHAILSPLYIFISIKT